MPRLLGLIALGVVSTSLAASQGLSVPDSTSAAAAPIRPKASTVVWGSTTPGSDSIYVQGVRFKTISDGTVYVAVAIQDTGWKLRTDVYVRNLDRDRLDVLPQQFTLLVDWPKPATLGPQSPASLAASIEKKAHWASFFGTLAAALSTQTVTTTTTGSSSASAYDNNGNRVVGSSSGSAVSVTTIPNLAAQEIAARNSALRIQAAEDSRGYLEAVALKANTLWKGDDVSGALFFDRTSTPDMTLRLNLGATIYEFPYGVREPDRGITATVQQPDPPKPFAVAIGAYLTITLEDGSILAARSVGPQGENDIQATLMDGAERFVGKQKVKAIMDAKGNNRTKEVIANRKKLP